MLLKCYTQNASKFGKLSSGHRTGKGWFSLQSQRKAMPENVHTAVQLHSFHMLAKTCSESFKLGFKPRQHIKKQRHYFANKDRLCHLIKAMVFPVVMNGCESWTIKKAEHWRIDAFELWCWRRLLRVPWTARRSNRSILKEISPNIHRKDWCWNSNTLATWYKELAHWKRPWCWARLKRGGEGDGRGWDGWMASPTWRTWVWASSGSWWWTGKHGVLQSMGLQRVGHNLVTKQQQNLDWPWHENYALVKRSNYQIRRHIIYIPWNSAVEETKNTLWVLKQPHSESLMGWLVLENPSHWSPNTRTEKIKLTHKNKRTTRSLSHHIIKRCCLLISFWKVNFFTWDSKLVKIKKHSLFFYLVTKKASDFANFPKPSNTSHIYQYH